MKTWKIGLVGIGAVGTELIRILRQRNFPASEIRVMARSEREESIAGETFHVVPASTEAFEGLDIAFFAGTEGAKGASQLYGWDAVERGVFVVDNGDDFRMDDRVPLVIPEVNAAAMKGHKGFVANPNCSTIIALTVLGPLHRVACIESIVASTYQAVSGTGRAAIEELEAQVRAYAAGESIKAEVYPHQIAFNALPQIGSLKDAMPGYTSEEAKMLFETRKILEDARIRVSATCVRVPVLNGHSESLNVRFREAISLDDVRRVLGSTPGVKVVDDPSAGVYPLALNVSGKDAIEVGRIRVDETTPNSVALFVAGDNIRKGAALNAIQIAEKAIEMGLI
jgi:aspartate-semialdehyde dehydrogenase